MHEIIIKKHDVIQMEKKKEQRNILFKRRMEKIFTNFINKKFKDISEEISEDYDMIKDIGLYLDKNIVDFTELIKSSNHNIVLTISVNYKHKEIDKMDVVIYDKSDRDLFRIVKDIYGIYISYPYNDCVYQSYKLNIDKFEKEIMEVI